MGVAAQIAEPTESARAGRRSGRGGRGGGRERWGGGSGSCEHGLARRADCCRALGGEDEVRGFADLKSLSVGGGDVETRAERACQDEVNARAGMPLGSLPREPARQQAGNRRGLTTQSGADATMGSAATRGERGAELPGLGACRWRNADAPGRWVEAGRDAGRGQAVGRFLLRRPITPKIFPSTPASSLRPYKGASRAQTLRRAARLKARRRITDRVLVT